MKILIAAGIYPPDPGGPALHAQAQYVGFRKLGHETRLVAFSHYRWLPKGVRHAAYLAALISKSMGAKAIYAHDAAGVGLMALYAAKAARKKFLVRIGGDLAWERAAESGRTGLSMKEWYEEGEHKRDAYYRTTRKVLRRADAVIVVSQTLKDLYVRHYGIAEQRVHIVPNPMLEKKGFVSPVGEKIIFASRLVAYKNLEMVFAALAEVLPKHPQVVFNVMGDGPERAALEKLARQLGLENQIIFKGTVSQAEVIEATRDCLFALAPALTEFNPNYVLQALSYGKPFLISRENGLPFITPEPFLFNPRDKEELARKLEDLLSPGGYEESLSLVKSIDFAMSWEEVIKRNCEIIKSL